MARRWLIWFCWLVFPVSSGQAQQDMLLFPLGVEEAALCQQGRSQAMGFAVAAVPCGPAAVFLNPGALGLHETVAAQYTFHDLPVLQLKWQGPEFVTYRASSLAVMFARNGLGLGVSHGRIIFESAANTTTWENVTTIGIGHDLFTSLFPASDDHQLGIGLDISFLRLRNEVFEWGSGSGSSGGRVVVDDWEHEREMFDFGAKYWWHMHESRKVGWDLHLGAVLHNLLQERYVSGAGYRIARGRVLNLGAAIQGRFLRQENNRFLLRYLVALEREAHQEEEENPFLAPETRLGMEVSVLDAVRVRAGWLLSGSDTALEPWTKGIGMDLKAGKSIFLGFDFSVVTGTNEMRLSFHLSHGSLYSF